MRVRLSERVASQGATQLHRERQSANKLYRVDRFWFTSSIAFGHRCRREEIAASPATAAHCALAHASSTAIAFPTAPAAPLNCREPPAVPAGVYPSVTAPPPTNSLSIGFCSPFASWRKPNLQKHSIIRPPNQVQ